MSLPGGPTGARLTVALGALVAVGCGVAAIAAAPALARSHQLPRGLTSPDAFEVRPANVYFWPQPIEGRAVDGFEGAGTTSRELVHGRPPRIHWRRWGDRAVAHGTYYAQKCAERKGRRFRCRNAFETASATLTLWRVRHGRYTRLRFGDIGHRRDAFTPAYALREVRGAGVVGASRGPAWCAMTSRVCLGP